MAELAPEEGAKASLDITFKDGQEYNGKLQKVFVKGWEEAKDTNVYDSTDAPY